MQHLQKQWIKKAATISMVVLLLFIHVTKALHTHDGVAALKYSSRSASFQSSCAVCDFQLAHDADNFTELYSFHQPVFYIETGCGFITSSFSETHLHSFLRGPPAA